MLGQLIAQAKQLTILDMEASVEHMSRGTVRHVDALLIVVEPYYRALETAGRLAPLARELGIPRVYAVANKLRDERDEAGVLDYCSKHELPILSRVPFDEAILSADRAGMSLVDYDPHAPAVQEIERLSYQLEELL